MEKKNNSLLRRLGDGVMSVKDIDVRIKYIMGEYRALLEGKSKSKILIKFQRKVLLQKKNSSIYHPGQNI